MIAKLCAVLKLGAIHPKLLTTVFQVKRDKKTFLEYQKLLSLVKGFQTAHKRHSGPIHVAEFGVGRGGSSQVLAWLVGRYGGRLFLYDVFGRIPPPGEMDGQRAHERFNIILNQESEEYYGNVPNLLEVVRKEISAVCSPDLVEFIIGKYEDTLSQLKNDNLSFQLVHIDCDWYSSSKAVLAYLKDHLAPGAILQIDDYSNWEGSRKATDEAGWLNGYAEWLVEGALIIDMGVKKPLAEITPDYYG